MNKSSSGIKGFISFYTLESIMSESQVRILETKIEAKVMLQTGLISMACSFCVLYTPGPPP